MTNPITAGSTAPSLWSTPGTSSSGKQTLDQDAFLKLLVAQLEYQDPSKPADSTAFMAQTAQFTQVETLQEISKEQQQLVSAQLMQSASAMVGRTVSYTSADGTLGTGVVTSATFGTGEPTLRVGTTDVPLSTVTKVA
ncbi:MAG TPA: flagellar hook capping FlgD N-terminal domain-containing protein [Rugosimonospora sp.]|nr:flagellar hook capping FlgD N-terminal domain-containing protein [Rugosimonospora sp.]